MRTIRGPKKKIILLMLSVFLHGCGMNNFSREETPARDSLDNTIEISYERENNTLDNTYYKNAQGKVGEELKKALHEIIRKQNKLSYNEVKGALKETDEDPNDSNNVILLYAGRSQSKRQFGDENNEWNREHVWAASHGFEREKKGPGTDLHHVRAEDVSVNYDRDDLDFDYDEAHREDPNKDCGTRKHMEAPDTCYDDDSWEPRDEVKGDIARMLFYMAVRYEGDPGEPDLELVDKVNTSAPNHGKLSTLLRWHKQDPVDDSERKRNNIIYEERYQQNRNPFIDHPEWVELIW